MKLIICIFLAALLAYTTYLFADVLPWWTFAIGAFVVGWVVPQKAWLSFVGGFLGVFACWALVTWSADHENHSILSNKMAQVFGLKPSPFAMIFLSSFIGALIAGFASLTGAFVRKKPVHAEV